MKLSRIGIVWVILSLIFLSPASFAQQHSKSENLRGVQKILQKASSVAPISLAKYKSQIDRGISSIDVDLYSGNEWISFERIDLEYNEDRTVISEDVYAYTGQSYIQISSNRIELAANGYLTRYFTEDIGGAYSFDQQIFYNQDFTFIDSVKIIEIDPDETYLDVIEFVTHTTDSIEIVQYYDYGDGDSGDVYGDYALLQDGNYIEHYNYATFQDRYTYYDLTVIELLHLAFSDFQFYELYNDEYYFDSSEWVPYERQTLDKDGEKVVGILIEGWYDTGWEDDEQFVYDYDGDQILSRTYEYASGNSFQPETRRTYTYESATTSELDTEQPEAMKLSQNYPNPFNPSTVISYQLTGNSVVRLRVFDALGREIAVLVDELKTTGSYQVNFSAAGLSSGLYYYVLEQPELGIRMTRSMTLIK
jgi:hypothetical protein